MDSIKQTFEKMKAKAQEKGAQVELLLTGGDSLKLGFQKRQLEKFESTTSAVAGVRVLKNGSQGVSYTENLSEDSLMRTFQDAIENVETLTAGAHAAESQLKMWKPKGAIDLAAFATLYNDEEIDMSEKKKKASLFESGALDADSRVQSVPYNGFTESVSWKRILNSEGVDLEFKQKYWSGYSYLLAKQGEHSKMRGDGIVGRRFADVDPIIATKRAVEKAISSLGAVKLETGTYPVIIDRDAMPIFVQMLIDYLSAKSVFEKTSLLDGKLGQKVAADSFELIDDPHDLKGLGVRPFDDEGAPTQKTTLISQGVLKSFLTNSEYAEKMSLPHTASAIRSPQSKMDIGPSTLKIAKGSASLQEMLNRYPKVLRVTYVAGGLHAGFKESTGDFSMPVEGFYYENGKLVKPVDQIVVSGNILQLLQDIELIGSEWSEQGESIYSPDLLVKALSVAGA